MSNPTGFKDLKPTELYRSCIEDFAVPVDEEDKNKKTVLLAALHEAGVEWADYVAQHPEVAPEPEPVHEFASGGVITSNAPAHNSVHDEQETGYVTVAPEQPLAQPVVVVKEEIPLESEQQYIINMERDNPLFEVRGHRFTEYHPNALVSAADADYILTKEDGFRQATPSELREFYG